MSFGHSGDKLSWGEGGREVIRHPAASPVCKLCWDGFPKETRAWSPLKDFGRVYEDCLDPAQEVKSRFQPSLLRLQPSS